MSNLGFQRHNHAKCISSGVAAVDAYCIEQNLQFTPVRRRVIEILLERHKALGAYDILEQLRSEGLGSQPPVVYRALAFLVEHGFVHKVERLNAFVACASPTESHDPAFLICRLCGDIAETHSDTAQSSLGQTAQTAGFAIERTVQEAEGVCPNCDKATAL